MKTNQIPLLPGMCYHIYNHANGFEKLFRNDGNYQFFLRKYIKYIPPVADTFAYCLMPNHLHLMVRIKQLEQLPESFRISGRSLSTKISQAFGNLFSSYSQSFNKQQNRMGSLFIPNFKRKTVSNSGYFGNLVPYIHLNPVAADFVSHPAEWPYSSFLSLLSEKPSRLLRAEMLYFFGGQQGFLNAHKIVPEPWFLCTVDQW